MAPPSQPTLHPTDLARNTNRNLRERHMPTRLNGADLYVARIGNAKDRSPPPGQPKTNGRRSRSRACLCTEEAESDDLLPGDLSFTISDQSLNTSSSPPVSLHDELRFPDGRLSRKSTPSSTSSPTSTLLPTPEPGNTTTRTPKSHVHASRPCYRCITYMHNVGIKRVFWTNSSGDWEGGKVRDLVDVLDGVGSKGAKIEGENGPTQAALGMFVTKHEVLMLRRVMGAKQAEERTPAKTSGSKPGGCRRKPRLKEGRAH